MRHVNGQPPLNKHAPPHALLIHGRKIKNQAEIVEANQRCEVQVPWRRGVRERKGKATRGTLQRWFLFEFDERKFVVFVVLPSNRSKAKTFEDFNYRRSYSTTRSVALDRSTGNTEAKAKNKGRGVFRNRGIPGNLHSAGRWSHTLARVRDLWSRLAVSTRKLRPLGNPHSGEDCVLTFDRFMVIGISGSYYIRNRGEIPIASEDYKGN
ncbi:hypothetical protein V1477_010234 [Vespula maculifrons]|uniref:Uncharacterized protein n=1 Tax=Vespula maculifrons TaxID=7453 RepID=A0ABD2C7Z2_VESMC